MSAGTYGMVIPGGVRSCDIVDQSRIVHLTGMVVVLEGLMTRLWEEKIAPIASRNGS